MGVHGVLDGQLVQAEHVGDGLHLMGVGFVQADPDECLLARRFEIVHLVQRRGVGVLAGQPGALAVDGAIHHGPCDRDMNRALRRGWAAFARTIGRREGGNARNDGIGSLSRPAQV